MSTRGVSRLAMVAGITAVSSIVGIPMAASSASTLPVAASSPSSSESSLTSVSSPDVSQIDAALSAVRTQSGDAALQLHLVDSQTNSDNISQLLYIALNPGTSIGGSPLALAGSWNVILLGQGSSWSSTVIPPASSALQTAASQGIDSQPQTIAATVSVLPASGGALVGNSSSVNEAWISASSGSEAGTSMTAGSPAPLVDVGAGCIVREYTPTLNSFFGIPFVAGTDAADCTDPGVYYDDLNLWEFPDGPVADKTGLAALSATIYGWYETNLVSITCSGLPTGWFDNQQFAVKFYAGGSASTPVGGFNSPSAGLPCSA